MENEVKEQKVEMSKGKKVANIILDVFIGIFALVAVTLFVGAIATKINGDDAISFNNTEVRLVLTESMQWSDNTPAQIKEYEIKNVDKDDAVIISKAPDFSEENKQWYTDLQIGDVATFRYKVSGEVVTITHRIVGKEDYKDGYRFVLQGDNYDNGTPGCQYIYSCTENPDPFAYIIGKVTSVSPFIGRVLWLATNKIVIVCVVIIPCVVVIGFEVVKIVRILGADKREKKLAIENEKKEKMETLANDNKSKDEEIERLKKLLEEKEKK